MSNCNLLKLVWTCFRPWPSEVDDRFRSIAKESRHFRSAMGGRKDAHKQMQLRGLWSYPLQFSMFRVHQLLYYVVLLLESPGHEGSLQRLHAWRQVSYLELFLNELCAMFTTGFAALRVEALYPDSLDWQVGVVRRNYLLGMPVVLFSTILGSRGVPKADAGVSWTMEHFLCDGTTQQMDIWCQCAHQLLGESYIFLASTVGHTWELCKVTKEEMSLLEEEDDIEILLNIIYSTSTAWLSCYFLPCPFIFFTHLCEEWLEDSDAFPCPELPSITGPHFFSKGFFFLLCI